MNQNQKISKMIRMGHLDQADRSINNELLDSELSISRTVELKISQGQILFKKRLYNKTIRKVENILPICEEIQEILLDFKCHFILSNSLIRIGEFEKTIYHLNLMEDYMSIIQKDFPSEYKTSLSDILFIKALNARYQSHSNLAINNYRKCIELRDEIKDYYGTAEPRNHLGIILDHLGDSDAALTEYQLAIDLFTDFRDEISLLGVMNNIGLHYWESSNLEKAQKIFLSALEVAKENPNYGRIGEISLNIGLVSIDLGRLNDAKNQIEKALDYFEGIDDKKGILLSFMNLGIIDDMLWEFDSAIKYYFHAVELAEETGNKNELLKLFINIGITYKNQNMLELALQYFNKAQNLNINLQSTLSQSKILYLLATTQIQLSQVRKAEILQLKLHKLSEKTKNIVVDRSNRLLIGIILKSKSGLTNRAKALEIFGTIIREESVSYEIAMTAIVNLCEILVTEVQITKNEGDLNEIEVLIKKMEQLSVANQSSIVKINIVLLKSRIAFMFEEIDNAVDLLEQAKSIAEVKNIKYLEDRVQEERSYLESKVISMQHVGDLASERLDLVTKRNSDYIDFLKKNFKTFVTSK